jgi:methylase of polypeptide subunit release factors
VNPSEFAVKWMGSTRPERAASQEHFIDVCGMLDVPTPNQADPTGDWYAFEKGAEKLGGGDGFADVWMRDHFAWEYKGKRKDLAAAYHQLNEYREALDNPPLLIVCDLDRFEVHTNFTGTAKVTHRFTLADLAASPDGPLRVLRAAFTDPESLRPTRHQEELTEKAAHQFAELAAALRSRGHEARAVANFLDRMVFTMFAEDAGLLPKGILERLATATRNKPASFSAGLGELFAKMANDGGLFGVEPVEWFNGGLFEDSAVLPLTINEIDTVRQAAALNWSQIEPAIFGTLFERGLDPDQRAQLGAHYTDRASILKLVEPVLMAPLRRDYATMQTRVTELVREGGKLSARTPAQEDPRRVFRAFLERLRATTVLDPACGSGSFLYVVLQLLKDMERDALAWGSLVLQQPQEFPEVGPHNLLGLEINPYAAELARVTIWIGELQWMLANGFSYRRNPILQHLDNITQQDALLDLSDPAAPREAAWPEADVVVGNPPFLGAKLLRAGLGDEYVEALYSVFGGRLPGMSDLCAYWHEKARAQIESRRLKRAGLLATQGIRGGRGRRVLERISEGGAIFFAYADEPWVLSGAAVHISFIGQDDGSETPRTLDGKVVDTINPDLTTGADLGKARRLAENAGIAFIPDVKGGPFDIDEPMALRLLSAPNPDGRTNADVVRPWVNGLDVTRRPRHMWIIDFGVDLSESEAALFEAPFEYVREHVRPERAVSRTTELDWWIHERPGHSMRAALVGLSRYIATPETAKHRLFVWLPSGTLADHSLVVFASEDDYLFGVLQSRIHERWSLAVGTQLETRPRYTPTTCFEKFAFPQPTHDQRDAIAKIARDLDRLRSGWLNPPGLPTALLERRTLTNLYNEPPTWLENVHADLDRAVLDAYGWPADLDDDSILERLLKLNLERDSA